MAESEEAPEEIIGDIGRLIGQVATQQESFSGEESGPIAEDHLETVRRQS